jgi:hypothetical protein
VNRWLAALVGCTLALSSAAAQTPPAATPAIPRIFRLEVDGASAHQPSWIVLVRSDGTGLYWPSLTGKEAQQEIHLSPATWKVIEAGAPDVQFGHCGTKQKNIAKTGDKKAEYHPGTTPDTSQSCDFDYSGDPRLESAVTAITAMVETMRLGEALAHLHRFDRLGLDAEMASLTEELKGGQAIEVENIAPTLQSIADDDRVIDRVRRQAARLLAPEPPG